MQKEYTPIGFRLRLRLCVVGIKLLYCCSIIFIVDEILVLIVEEYKEEECCCTQEMKMCKIETVMH